MTQNLRDKWCVALRSGKYQQCSSGDFEKKGKVCAVRVLEIVNGGSLPGLRQLDSQLGARIHALNESEKKTFTEIAIWIEANVPLA